MINPVKWVKEQYNLLYTKVVVAPLDRFPGVKTYLTRQVRIVYLVIKGYQNDGINIKASALTYFTVLSVVPLLALAFGISKGFGLQDTMRAEIIKGFANQQQVMNWILDFANNALLETSGGVLAGVGIVMLFYTVGNLLGYIEKTFNSIWKVEQTRAWYRKITDYLTIILFFPAILIASSSATVLANTKLDEILGKYEVLESLRPLITLLLRLLPFILIALITTATYLVMPNAKVKYRNAITAGLIAAIALQILMIFYLQLQMGASRLGTLYGSFAAVPLLMVWVQMSWVVVLVGAQLSFYLQHITKHEFEFDVQNVSLRQKRRLSILVMHLLVKDFIAGNKPKNPQEISSAINVPIRSVRESLSCLKSASLVTEILNETHEIRSYQPAIDVNKITLAFIMERIDSAGASHKGVIHHADYKKVDNALNAFETLIANSEGNVLLRNL